MKDHEGFCEFLCHQTHIDPLLGLLFCVQAGHVWKGVNGYKWLQLNTSLKHIKTSLIIIWPHFFGQCAQMSLRIHLLQNASGADGAAWQASCARRGPGTQISPLPSHDWQSQICFLLCCVNFVTPGSGSGPFAWAHWRATTCCRQRAKRPHISSNFLAFHHDTMVQGCQREAIISVFGIPKIAIWMGNLRINHQILGHPILQFRCWRMFLAVHFLQLCREHFDSSTMPSMPQGYMGLL